MSEIIPFKKTVPPQDLVLRFMHSAGHKKDAEFYINLFSKTKAESFAIIVLEEEGLRDEFDSILFEIRYLLRLSLYPVVLIRSTSDYMGDLELENYFKKAKLTSNVLSHESTQDEKLEFVEQRIRRRELPVLHLDPQRDIILELTNLANLLRTSKIIFLKRSGGIIDHETQTPIGLINLKFERDGLLVSPTVNDEDKLFLQICDHIIRACDHKLCISIVSPNNLLRELFTVKGAGSLIQLGSHIQMLSSLDQVDTHSLQKLLEISLEKTISPIFFRNKFDHIYLEENYLGVALLRNYQDMAYLMAFAVGTEARGLGIGKDLWKEICNHHKRFFWRSKPDKFITHWYTKQCDGMHRTPEWTVFWRGLRPNEVSQAIEYAIGQADD